MEIPVGFKKLSYYYYVHFSYSKRQAMKVFKNGLKSGFSTGLR